MRFPLVGFARTSMLVWFKRSGFSAWVLAECRAVLGGACRRCHEAVVPRCPRCYANELRDDMDLFTVDQWGWQPADDADYCTDDDEVDIISGGANDGTT